MKVADARNLIGKRVQWLEHVNSRGGLLRYGVIECVSGKNVFLEDGDVKWLPWMEQLQEVVEIGESKS